MAHNYVSQSGAGFCHAVYARPFIGPISLYVRITDYWVGIIAIDPAAAVITDVVTYIDIIYVQAGLKARYAAAGTSGSITIDD